MDHRWGRLARHLYPQPAPCLADKVGERNVNAYSGGQVAIGVGFIAATAYSLHHYVLPHLLNWLKPAGSADKALDDKRIGEAVAAVIQKQVSCCSACERKGDHTNLAKL